MKEISEATIWDVLERIQDPCSVASGAPAGLVSMGLVRGVKVTGSPNAARVKVTLCITEPGCLMSAVFKRTAQEDLSQLPGVESVSVEVDHGYIWDPSDMTPAYRERLERKRATTLEHMRTRRKVRRPGVNTSSREIT